jgi:hypothetical protein
VLGKWLHLIGILGLDCDVESVQGKNTPCVFRFAPLRLLGAAALAIYVLQDLRVQKDNALLMYVFFTHVSHSDQHCTHGLCWICVIVSYPSA